ncbi:hypothetical protein LR032_00245 [Candidatus Bipolaricaulota bacterium]|nr:hypothetical protein [Candidatus Bipolaricaulota bacterium]
MEYIGRLLAGRVPFFYHLPMDWERVWTVLKWVLVALGAGFIGQFGKSLALFLIRRRRNKKGPKTDPVPTNPVFKRASSDTDTKQAHLQAQAKIEKKRAKAEVKRRKKSG